MILGDKIKIDGVAFVVTSVLSQPDAYFVRFVNKDGNAYGRSQRLFLDRGVWRYSKEGRIVHVSR